MLPQEIRDIINKEADDFAFQVPYDGTDNFYDRAKLEGYTAAATKYAELMIEFAEWVHDNYFKVYEKDSIWNWQPLGSKASDKFLTTSDLLTIFLKEKYNLANENNIV